MITASELAGFVAAHVIWCVSDSQVTNPLVAFTTENGERKLERLVMADADAVIEYGRRQLEEDPLGANDGVFAYAGLIDGANGKRSAVILEMRCYGFPWAKATIAVPYTPAGAGLFRVHRPVLLEWRECEDFDSDVALTAFFEGVVSHQEGARIWKEAMSYGE